VIVLLLAVLYRTLRPGIKMARELLRTFRHFQQMSRGAPGAKSAGEKLVQCASCETWIPQSRALTASSAEYCSRECLKRSGAAHLRDSAA
jgi:hypothetical protein